MSDQTTFLLKTRLFAEMNAHRASLKDQREKARQLERIAKACGLSSDSIKEFADEQEVLQVEIDAKWVDICKLRKEICDAY